MLSDEQWKRIRDGVDKVCNREIDREEWPGVRVDRGPLQTVLVRLYGDVLNLEPEEEE